MKNKILNSVNIPEFEESIQTMPQDSKIYVDKGMELLDRILYIMQEKRIRRKELAERMGKRESEITKILSPMHNFTLRTLSKLEAALETEIITIP